MKTEKALRIIAIISGVLLTVLVLCPIVANLFLKQMISQYIENNTTSSVSVGIISGADGPTAIYTTTTQINAFQLVLRLGILAVCAIVFIYSIVLLRKRNKLTDKQKE